MRNINLRPLIIYFFIGLIVGYFARGWFGGSFNDGWEAARTKILGNETGEIIVTTITGSIIEVEDDQIIFAVDQLSELDQEKYNQREISIDKQTKIFLREPMTDEEYLGPDDYAKIQELEESLVGLSVDERDEIIKEIEDLRVQAMDNKKSMIEELAQESSQLSENDIEARADIAQKIAEVESGYKYTEIDAGQIQVGWRATVGADHNIYQDKKFTAIQIEIYQ